jgi:Na+/proline symporter
MSLLRSGLLLFVSVTGLATLFVVASFVWGSLTYGWPGLAGLAGWLMTVPLWFSAVTFPTTAMLTFAAWRGRRRPVLDGLILLPGIGLLACCCLYLWWLQSDDPMVAGGAGIVAPIYYLAGLAIAVPSYLIAYYTLRKSGLIAALTPPRKTKGPAEASP